ncbi:DUF4184 family protein [Lacisediminihabitans sp. H27-G8]|uniref:DUF4184 family protein n=1 Tax=Lacisediminihabitans sp. H27-G8 TaxID=3111909 RepID=UPI0038FCB2D4
MPFTPSHIAAILPFVRSPLAPAALVIGSMVPDLPYFLPLGIPRGLTHSIPGVPLADLPMGIVVLVLWIFVFRAPIGDFAPDWVRARLRPPEGPPRLPRFSRVAMILVSLLVGIATHLAWDSFTHPDGWVVLHVAGFRAQLGPFAAYRWAQYASSVGGLVIVAIWAVGWVRRMPSVGTRASGTDSTRLDSRVRIAVWVTIGVVLAAVALAIWIGGVAAGADLFDRTVLYRTATISIAFSGLLAVLACLGWYVLPKGARSAARMVQ